MLIKKLLKKIAFGLFPHVEKYNERISNLEKAISVLAESGAYKTDDKALNAQIKRKEIVERILEKQKPEVIVETGTHLGDSTGYFARFAESVLTSDSSPIYMWAAKTRLARFSNIDYFIGDSRDFLRNVTKSDGMNSKSTLFYLDAHWHEDLPLHEEIEIVVGSCKKGNWIILIDDFCVPGDAGYAYPSYGEGKTLNFEYIKDIVAKNELDVFFPTIPSREESGYRTGYVFLSNGGDVTDILKSDKDLKQFRG
jgi:cephalosporin hydroxylase